MNNKIRNQLIGFITLILIALLVSPYVFTNKSRQIDISIPLLTTTEELDNKLAQNTDKLYEPPVTDVQIETDDTISQPIADNLVNEENNQSDNEQEVSKNYVIQLIALKNSQKIEELVALLRLYNYDAYTIPKIPQEGILTRLFVGPYLTRKQADIAIIDIEHLTKLKGFVTTK